MGEVVAKSHFGDSIKREARQNKDKVVYLTSGFDELGAGVGLNPRKARIFFEFGLAALIKDCHFFVSISFTSPTLAQSTS
jgi:hypothetical protein